MERTETLIEFILKDWCRRVIAELDAKGIAPAPWQIRQALGWVNTVLLKMSGEEVGGGEDAPPRVGGRGLPWG